MLWLKHGVDNVVGLNGLLGRAVGAESRICTSLYIGELLKVFEQ